MHSHLREHHGCVTDLQCRQTNSAIPHVLLCRCRAHDSCTLYVQAACSALQELCNAVHAELDEARSTMSTHRACREALLRRMQAAEHAIVKLHGKSTNHTSTQSLLASRSVADAGMAPSIRAAETLCRNACGFTAPWTREQSHRFTTLATSVSSSHACVTASSCVVACTCSGNDISCAGSLPVLTAQALAQAGDQAALTEFQIAGEHDCRIPPHDVTRQSTEVFLARETAAKSG